MTMSVAIVEAAREWIGTRFAHQGRAKKTADHAGGVDCLGLLVGVARALDLRTNNGAPLAQFDNHHYGHNPECYTLEQTLDTLLARVEMAAMRAGDIALMCLEKSPQHLGIISDYCSSLRGAAATRPSNHSCYSGESRHPETLKELDSGFRRNDNEGGESGRSWIAAATASPRDDGGALLGLIHAYAHARKVVEHSLSEEWREKIIAVYRMV